MELYLKKKIEKQQQELNMLQNILFTTGKWEGPGSLNQMQNLEMQSALSNIRARLQVCGQLG